MPMLRVRDQVPHFTVTTIQGMRVAYTEIWQRKNLLLMVLPGETSAAIDAYLAELQAHQAELTAHDTAVVLTHDTVSGVACPGVVVADRWGEIHFAAGAATAADLPAPGELIEWLRYVQMQCPECQGEAW